MHQFFSSPGIDKPDSKQLPPWLHWLDECPSTNTWAIQQAAQLHHGDVVFTRRQTAGRGQQGRVWHSPPGVMTASVVLETLRSDRLPSLSLVAGLAVIYAVEDLMPELQATLRLKWANDVYVQGCKLAGILCEAKSGYGTRQCRTIVGIGLNRQVEFAKSGISPEQLGNPISLHHLSAQVPGELALLDRLRHYLLQAVGVVQLAPATASLTPLLADLHDRNMLYGHTITIATTGGTIVGRSGDIDAVGRLCIHLPNGTIQKVISGHVLHWEEG